jgi:hypothetical protein
MGSAIRESRHRISVMSSRYVPQRIEMLTFLHGTEEKEIHENTYRKGELR